MLPRQDAAKIKQYSVNDCMVIAMFSITTRINDKISVA